jgi:CheY-like chemotaxis protein
LNILYVDDEPNDIHLVELFVNTTPHQLMTTNNMEDAQTALSEQPDLVLMDILIGNTRAGFDFIQHARQVGYTQPMVAVTGLSTADDIQSCLSAGFDRVLVKPFSILQLAEIIDAYAQ